MDPDHTFYHPRVGPIYSHPPQKFPIFKPIHYNHHMNKDTITRQTTTGPVYLARLRDPRTRKAIYLGAVRTREELDTLYANALAAHKANLPLPKKTNKVTVSNFTLTRTQWYRILGVCQQAVHRASVRHRITVEEEIARRVSLIDPRTLAERAKNLGLKEAGGSRRTAHP